MWASIGASSQVNICKWRTSTCSQLSMLSDFWRKSGPLISLLWKICESFQSVAQILLCLHLLVYINAGTRKDHLRSLHYTQRYRQKLACQKGHIYPKLWRGTVLYKRTTNCMANVEVKFLSSGAPSWRLVLFLQGYRPLLAGINMRLSAVSYRQGKSGKIVVDHLLCKMKYNNSQR